jgi:hypothetical protein
MQALPVSQGMDVLRATGWPSPNVSLKTVDVAAIVDEKPCGFLQKRFGEHL